MLPTQLNDDDLARYEWQLSVPDFGRQGQERLKNSSVLVSRVGGVGGTVACYLAAAGVGRLVLAHAGDLRAADLNRQILMSNDWVGRSRVECAAGRLRAINPLIRVDAVAENISARNADRLVSEVDLVVDAAPLFSERFAMNQAAVKFNKPMVECAMYELEGQLTTILPGRTPCLACLHPTDPPAWKRQFPVIGAVAGTIGCLAAMEAIKCLAGIGQLLAGRLLVCDLRDMAFRTVGIQRDPRCRVCTGI